MSKKQSLPGVLVPFKAFYLKSKIYIALAFIVVLHIAYQPRSSFADERPSVDVEVDEVLPLNVEDLVIINDTQNQYGSSEISSSLPFSPFKTIRGWAKKRFVMQGKDDKRLVVRVTRAALFERPIEKAVSEASLRANQFSYIWDVQADLLFLDTYGYFIAILPLHAKGEFRLTDDFSRQTLDLKAQNLLQELLYQWDVDIDDAIDDHAPPEYELLME